MEPEVWDALMEICRREGHTSHDICTLLSKWRGQSSLTSALRVFILGYYRAAATEVGHAEAGHGKLPRKR